MLRPPARPVKRALGSRPAMANDTKSVVVTGASRGIGRAVVEHFLEAGYRVWALARSAEALADLEQRAPGRVRALPVDVADEAAVRSACRAILAEGAPYALVNNAGISVSAPLAKTALADYQRVMDVNVRAPFLFCQELLPAMAERGEGRVINVASTAATKGFRYTAAYCASKHALLGLTRALAVEFARKGLTVNAVCPGWTETDMLASAASSIQKATGRTPDQARDALASMNAQGRIVQPGEVAALCVFLASPAAVSVTGAAYAIDGGETA